MAELDLEPELDRLYAAPLAEFIAARNALAKRLRAAGARQQAEEVKALAKPSVTAWAVNALFHQERRRLEGLFDAATAVRAALAGEGDRREAEAARRQALRALLGLSKKLLAEAGHAATPANRQRISHTLEALAARDPADPGPRPGRLTADLEPQGFDVLAGLAGSLASAAPSPPRPRRPAAKAAAGSQAAAARNRRLEAARRKLEAEETQAARLDKEVEEAEAAVGGASRRHQRLVEDAAEAERQAGRAAEAAAAAETDLAAARAALAGARTARRRGLSRLATARRRLERLEG